MPHSPIYPPVSPVPLPTLQGQGKDNFAPFSAYLTTEDVGQLLRVTTDTAQRLIRNGDIRASFVGRRWLVQRSAIADYLESRAEGGPEVQ